MKSACINWNKVIANAGLAFCTTFLATGFNGYASVLNAALIAGIALFSEMKEESEPKGITKMKAILSKGLVL